MTTRPGRALIGGFMHPVPSPSPPSTATRAVIFDLDGVLVWSVPMHWYAFRKTFEAVGRDFPLEEYMSFAVGASREQVIRHVLGNLPERELKHHMEEKERHMKVYLQETGLQPIPGALDFVRAARGRGLKTAVATAGRTPELLLGSVGALELFDAIVGRGKVARSKPHPDVYLLAAETLGVPPASCLVVEDSSVGVAAGRAAGMRVLALTTTEGPEGLRAADAVYGGFPEIPVSDWLGRASAS